ncbi:CDGSH iron-sulfur domain-containing protein [candidate division KSB1 bacterium]|nr:MAG: CDGSH iron-sulfur domain-containing protein [candidate division KSB1 bacterium]
MSEKELTITINKNGPYVVTNVHVLQNSKGEALATKDVISLCRCGQSKSKPFCDGSHRTTGFVDEKN